MKNYALNKTELNNKMNKIKNTVNTNGTTTFTIPHFTARCQIVMECYKYGLKATRPTKANAYIIISIR